LFRILRRRPLAVNGRKREVTALPRFTLIPTGAYWASPQKGQAVDRACSGFLQCQQNPGVIWECGALRSARGIIWGIDPK
jgi:hypothetical protein